MSPGRNVDQSLDDIGLGRVGNLLGEEMEKRPNLSFASPSPREDFADSQIRKSLPAEFHVLFHSPSDDRRNPIQRRTRAGQVRECREELAQFGSADAL